MGTPFLSPEEYDERAHQKYNEGRFDEALDILRDGLSLYPNAVDLHVGVGFARLAREEFAWARRAFEEGLVLDPEHEDALAGLGETLLRFNQRDAALRCFRLVLELGYDEDIDMAQETLLAAASTVVQAERIAPWVLDEPQVLGIEDLTAESVLLRLKVKTVPSRQWEVARQLRAAARVALSDAGISLAPMGSALLATPEAAPAPEQGQDTAVIGVLAPSPAAPASPARISVRGRRSRHPRQR